MMRAEYSSGRRDTCRDRANHLEVRPHVRRANAAQRARDPCAEPWIERARLANRVDRDVELATIEAREDAASQAALALLSRLLESLECIILHANPTERDLEHLFVAELARRTMERGEGLAHRLRIDPGPKRSSDLQENA